MIVLAGTAIGAVGFFLFHGIELTHTGRFADLWKYGIAHAVTIVVLFVLLKARFAPLVPPIALTLLGLASLGFNFPSQCVVCLPPRSAVLTSYFSGVRPGAGGPLRIHLRVGVFFLIRDAAPPTFGVVGVALPTQVDQTGRAPSPPPEGGASQTADE